MAVEITHLSGRSEVPRPPSFSKNRNNLISMFKYVSSALVALTLAGCSHWNESSSLPNTAAPDYVTLGVVQRTKSKLTTLYAFTGGTNGANPNGVTSFNGTLYGTVDSGGISGYGQLFAIGRTGKQSVIHDFKGASDGGYPLGNLLVVNGLLYGTTEAGGQYGAGTVFELKPPGSFHVIYSFKDSSDGAFPYAGLTYLNGNLYGTTLGGGSTGLGTVFEMSLSGTEKVLYSFQGNSDGASPYAGLVALNGTLYGTTHASGEGGSGFGTVYAIDTNGDERVLYTFLGGADGLYPDGGLIAANGLLFGTTANGGGNGNNGNGYGTVFSVTVAGVKSLLYSFQGTPDGALPVGDLVYLHGDIYGTTGAGGAGCNGMGCGTIFKATMSGQENAIYRFKGKADYEGPNHLINRSGSFFGTTYSPATGNNGSIFKFDP